MRRLADYWAAAARSEERGSAPVSFALVALLVVVAVLGALQLAFALHVRNLTVSAAGEGARAAALAGADDAAALSRVHAELDAALAAGVPRQVTLRRENLGSALPGAGQATHQVVVTITTVLPVVGPWGPARGLTVSGRALVEPAN
ncbi:TadE/TadG family type IV pilus assembly protein [Buchananella hordeovulneris]|uniref:TadE/TadG family type IV pilus assembly protein n=1 Tax=Buchananella hordeovulneris TaxID=52770 RepID=UPI0026DAA528|nr:TadE/TadG family type IV pilus assembly protein [Buchananella hordeovulneris]MDO5080720.1 TadE/TadG family type IV pilus assembly protein [Buchananella hordeovulneris]